MSKFPRATKISKDQITYGPTHAVLDEVEIFLHAGTLNREGWVGTSNAYCRIKRIDRDDWVQVLAKNLRCAPADFYVPGDNKPADNWKEHYLRCYSKEQHTVHPQIYDALKKMAR